MGFDPFTQTLPVTVDRSHLVVIGEKLYARSLELIRELVNNSYDADAAEVHVVVSPEEVLVEDDGTGMDREGLVKYFQVGVPDKRLNPVSPVHGRDRIGQFGIGKFATLAAAERFEVTTRRDGFSARVVFDRSERERGEGEWHLPLDLDPPDGRRRDGTTVRLTRLTKRFDPQAVREFLVEAVPLKAPSFAVYVNGLKLVPRSLSGRRIPFLEPTPHGVVSGEVVILPASRASTENLGLEVKVKGVTVRRELFGMTSWGKQVARVRGVVEADFLPLTADRSNFVEDGPEYRRFLEVMDRVMGEVEGILLSLALRKENRLASRAVGEALQRVETALRAHPELSPFGALPIGEESDAGGDAALTGSDRREGGEGGPAEEGGAPGAAQAAPEPEGEAPGAPPPATEVSPEPPTASEQPRVHRLTPNAVVRKVKMGATGMTCCIDAFGPDGPEAFTEGSIIYINRDHPLYRHEQGKRETMTRYLARLVTQEIALMNERDDPRRAFRNQNVLLRDAFAD